uniref:Uncharacterized protein n=1 Tax=Labrus bergylta TaxID=56723 RepID=A0A3Q3FS30_9LABR
APLSYPDPRRNVKTLRISPGRCRSTVASTKKREEKEQQMDGCTVVEAAPADLINQTKNSTNTHLKKIHVDFDNTQEAYKSKGNIELLRSLLVFKLCTIDVLVAILTSHYGIFHLEIGGMKLDKCVITELLIMEKAVTK